MWRENQRTVKPAAVETGVMKTDIVNGND